MARPDEWHPASFYCIILLGGIGGLGGETESVRTTNRIPDVIFPTDNEWGVPLLDLNMQAIMLNIPITKWGTIGRHGKMAGTYHFYTDDYKFTALWGNPWPVISSSCVSVVEPNFSTHEQMPKAVALWDIYRKRWLARFWQSYGVRIFVDLNVEPHLMELNMLGVPHGWMAYATRWLDRYAPDSIEDQWRLAQR